MTMPIQNVKARKRNPPSEFAKELKKIREHHTPLHTVEIEIKVLPFQQWKLIRINEQLRVIRNTVLGQLYKNYSQMIRTKEFKKVLKKYRLISNTLNKSKDEKEKKILEKEQKDLTKRFEELRNKHNITFEYARNYGASLRTRKYKLPDAVTVWNVCEIAWRSMERLIFGEAMKPRFHKRGEFVPIQGKQAERCVILKHNSDEGTIYITHNGMSFPLDIKEKDLFIEETLSHIAHYMRNTFSIDKENVERYLAGKSIVPTYRIRNNRIVLKEIRGKLRFFVQIVLEGLPVVKRKKDGSFRHSYGSGKIGGDIGTQTLAVVSQNDVDLFNLAERSKNTFYYERVIYLIQRYLARSRKSTNPQNYNSDGTIKKGKKEWVYSKRYLKAKGKLKNLHRKAALSRKYAHNEDINRLRTLGDQFIIETMNIKALQRKAKEITKNEKTGKFNRRKRFGKSIGKRSPGYFINQVKYRFAMTGGTVHEVNTWTYKASQYDHELDDTNKKQLSKRWHTLPDGRKIQRDIYSAFLLFCSKKDLQKPDRDQCLKHFENFYEKHQLCVQEIKENRKFVLNSGIKIS
ncbi:hypothetical protein [Bacillus benzoevorans]|uniref:Transposase n=1 Tax=Bacillus benzoevorans TaxID=1456 RepID=A0A7X0HSR2_9BACI|nr:hypothetical protein [Bacillus benzoevorans]MBB6445232.1 hypothetical protein [Bacillus benzoevorans]